MTDITALAQRMKAAAEKATPGEWWSDVVETDGEYGEGEDRHSGYHSYAVYVGSESLLDMTNSTAACIHEEWDHDYHMAWDETAKSNAEFIVEACPANVLALVEALEKAQQRIAELESCAVELPLPSCTYADHSYPAYSKRQVVSILAAAGIQVIEGEQQ